MVAPEYVILIYICRKLCFPFCAFLCVPAVVFYVSRNLLTGAIFPIVHRRQNLSAGGRPHSIVLSDSTASSLHSHARASVLLMSYSEGHGEDGLRLLWSPDGYAWHPLRDGASFLQPSADDGLGGLMRDPSLAVGPDGTFHLVWTTALAGHAVGYASSKDLIRWSPQRALRLMAHEPKTRNCWAPELFYNERGGVWLVFWASTVVGRFSETAGSGEGGYNHRMYATTTLDFVSFSATRLLHDPGFSTIDGTLLRPAVWHAAWHAGVAGGPAGPAGRTAGSTAGGTADSVAEELLWIVADDSERPEQKKHVRMCRAAWAVDDAGVPSLIFGALGPPLSPAGVRADGPSAVRLPDYWIVYYHAQNEERYRAMRSADLLHWEDATPLLSLPLEGRRVRHGSIAWLPDRRMLDRLLQWTHRTVESNLSIAAFSRLGSVGMESRKDRGVVVSIAAMPD